MKKTADQTTITIPQHLGIILDGNRRWAKGKNLASLEGHNQGLNRVEEVVREAFKQGVKVVSLFVFSTDNWRRSVKEVDYLMKLFLRYLEQDSQRLLDDGVQFKIAGDLSQSISPEIKKAIAHLQKESLKNDGPIVVLCFNYGGQAEILEMVKKIVKKRLKADKINLQALKEALYLPEIPDLDLVIRTSGEQRLSGFQLWRAAYAEMLFIDKNWPDFTRNDLRKALKTYSQRSRRFGGG